jgi:hypothetical protein
MDLSKVVQYDETFPVQIRHRITGEHVGLTVNVTSFEGAAAMKAERAIAGVRMQKQYLAQQSGLKPEDIDFAELQNEADQEKAIAAVQSWEWAEGLTWNGKSPPKCDDAGKREVLLHPNSGWILAQVINAGKRIENFTGPSVTNV